MSEQRQRMTDQEVEALNDIILQSHYRQLREQGQLRQMEAFRTTTKCDALMVAPQLEFTPEDCVFLRSCGIQVERN